MGVTLGELGVWGWGGSTGTWKQGSVWGLGTRCSVEEEHREAGAGGGHRAEVWGSGAKLGVLGWCRAGVSSAG